MRRKLVWACRRGMLELDVILADLAHEIKSMSARQLQVTESFLQLDDNELWAMLVGGTKQPSPVFAAMVASIAPKKKTHQNNNKQVHVN